jgi:uncharacterized protein (DUF2336 family)
MIPPASLIDELEQAFSNGDIARRAKALRLVADLFSIGSGQFSNEHIELFDQIMQSIVGKIDISARAAFSKCLSSLPDAPGGVIRLLAFDEAIEVAGPVLQSARIEQADLVLNAQTMSQPHLLAISERAVLPEQVTDVLLERGNPGVARSTARNAGAIFSDNGYATLVERSRNDDDLALSVWARPELPRLNLVKLFVEASGAVQELFEAQAPRQLLIVRELVARASTELLKHSRTGSPVHVDALTHVVGLHRTGALNDERLMEFAELGDFDRTAIAMSLMCNLPIELVEQVLVRNVNPEQLLVLTKATNLTWRTTKAILMLSARPDRVEDSEMERAFATFTRLQVKTAMAAAGNPAELHDLRHRQTDWRKRAGSGYGVPRLPEESGRHRRHEGQGHASGLDAVRPWDCAPLD